MHRNRQNITPCRCRMQPRHRCGEQAVPCVQRQHQDERAMYSLPLKLVRSVTPRCKSSSHRSPARAKWSSLTTGAATTTAASSPRNSKRLGTDLHATYKAWWLLFIGNEKLGTVIRFNLIAKLNLLSNFCKNHLKVTLEEKSNIVPFSYIHSSF